MRRICLSHRFRLFLYLFILTGLFAWVLSLLQLLGLHGTDRKAGRKAKEVAQGKVSLCIHESLALSPQNQSKIKCGHL